MNQQKIYNICTLAGDGVGPELLDQALILLDAIGLKYNQVSADIGFSCYQKSGTPLPKSTIEAVTNADASLLIAVTTPPHIKNYRSPIVNLRKKLSLYANVRPIKSLSLPGLQKGVDMVVVRENTEGLYSGKETSTNEKAVTKRIITRKASQRIARFAFKLAQRENRHRVTAIHKANVMRLSDGLFLRSVQSVARKFPDISMEDMLVDSAAMRLIKDPHHFDVIVTTNMFGDILSDMAAMLIGGLGVAASGNLGDNTAVFEPVHGSAPKYQGKDTINPLATFYATTMMLEYIGETAKAKTISHAIRKTIKQKITTQDIGGSSATSQVTRNIISHIRN
jgi:isopropylmalate/isohomocitrate dehydrogenase-like protein